MSFRDTQNPGIGGLDEITDAEALFLQNLAALSYAQGDILYHNGSDLVRLAAGTNGQLLKTQGTGANPVWANEVGGGDVSKVGTPVDNQVGVWTGDGTIEGKSGFTYDDATEDVVIGGYVDFGTTLKLAGTDVLTSDNTSGSVTLGHGAGASLLPDGGFNTAIGNGALTNATSSDGHTAIGYHSLMNNAAGKRNSGVGYQTLHTNTTGDNNVAMGYQSLYTNLSGDFNTAIGDFALYSNTTVNSNTAVGFQSLFNITTGAQNTAIGYNAGHYFGSGIDENATSTNSIYLGHTTRASADGNTNEIVIGYNVLGLGSNTVTLGNDSIVKTYLKGDVVVPNGSGLIIGNDTQITADATAEFQVLGTSGSDSTMILARFANDGFQPHVDFVKSRSTTIGSNAIVQNNDALGGLHWHPDDGVNYTTSTARFIAQVDDASPAAGDIGTEFVWSLMPGGGGAIRTVMRIAANGQMTVQSGGVDIASSEAYSVSGTDILSDSAGTMTLSNINALDATTATTIATGADNASLTTTGVIEIATVTETNTGTDATRAVSPDGLDGWIGSAQITSVGALNSGSITADFGNINNGTHDISGGTINAIGDTSASDDAAMGYTATEGLILTGQGSTNDVTIKNDVDGTVISIPTGTTNVNFANSIYLTEQAEADGDTAGLGQIWVDTITPNELKFTDDTGVDYNLSKSSIRWLPFILVEAGTDCATATNIAGDFVSPIAGTILQSDSAPYFIYTSNSTAGTTGTMVVDVSINGTTIMDTNKLDTASGQKNSYTSSTHPDLTTTTLAVGDIITFDIDSVHTTAAKGLTVYIAIRE